MLSLYGSVYNANDGVRLGLYLLWCFNHFVGLMNIV